MGQVGDELSSQAASQQARVAEGLQAMGSEFSEMAHSASGSGYATELVRGAGERADAVARWLEARDPRSIVEEVKGFARRRPGVFLAIAVGAGVLAGRLTRALAEPSDDSSSPGRMTPPRGRELDDSGFAAPAVPPVSAVPPTSTTTVGAATGGGVRRRHTRRPAHPPPHRPLTPACRPGQVSSDDGRTTRRPTAPDAVRTTGGGQLPRRPPCRSLARRLHADAPGSGTGEGRDPRVGETRRARSGVARRRRRGRDARPASSCPSPSGGDSAT